MIISSIRSILYFQSEAWEIILADNNLLFLTFSFMLIFVGVLFLFLSLLRGFLAEKTKALNSLIKSNLWGSELNEVLSVSFAQLFVFFRFNNNKFFFLDPFSIKISLPVHSFLLISIVDFNSLVFVVLLKSKSSRLFRLDLFNNWSWCFFSFRDSSRVLLRCLLIVFIALELVLHVANISPSSTFFSYFITE